jgi:diguanylate cyclase (GGDEF)-like protein
MFVVTHQEQQMPCSLIIMDLDRFKSVNDTYGHQAGDQALISLASILKSSCRSGDLVARYGGEEFVMLCANCDNTTAARRAEEVRVALAQMPQPALDGRPVTASFGVTEIQPGDTAETMLRRADRGLLMAKTQGRNQVVQLGTGSAVKDLATRLAGASSEAETLLERTLVSSVPIRIAIEKLRGFVADHEAKIVKTDGNRVELTIDDDADRQRRYDDRPIRFRMTLRFKEQRDRTKDETSQSRPVQTRIFVSITPLKNRDRRRANIAGRARDVLISFQSYLMATEVEGGAEETHQPVDGRSWIARLLGCWLNFNGPADR